jgi:hypothetical protein
MLGLLVDDLGQTVVRVLAVAGGAAVGGLLAGAIVGLLVRKVARRQPPPAVRTFFRLLGGLAGGLAVGVLLFTRFGGDGGWFGGGGGTGPSKGGLASTHASVHSPDAASDKSPAQPTQPAPKSVRVVMLGGDLVRNGAAYRVDGEPQARTLADVRHVIEQRMAADPPITALDIVVYDNSVARESAPVDVLERWARQNGLTVNVITTPGDVAP